LGLEGARVVEVFAPAAGGGRGSFGSGYLVDDRRVLTARHVVEGTPGQCEVRPLGAKEWLSADVVWRGEESDAALLRIPGKDARRPVRLGRLPSGARAPCRALGFPLAQAKGRVRDTEEIVGEVAPLTARKSGLLTVHIDGSVPDRDSSGHSPWEGYSGAALFCGPLLVGVLTVDPVHFGTRRLEAVPVTAMAAEAGFRAALAAPEPELLPAFEDESARAMLAPPYAPLPARASSDFFRRSPIHLLYPQYGIVPFHGRRAELVELARWLDGEGFAVAVLLGRGGSGKTRLAAELCRMHEGGAWLAGFLAGGSDADPLASSVSPLLLVLDEAHTRLDELAALITRLASDERPRPTRLLLLTREREWWDTALPQRLEGDLEAQLTLAGAWVRELGPLEETADARGEVFHEAARAFGEWTERSRERLAVPDLGRELFERVIFIHLAALTALERSPVSGGPLIHAELLGARLAQEARYWESSARQAGLEALDERVRRRAVTLATLTTAASEGEAAALLAAVPDLADEGEGLRRRVAHWLSSLYPGEGFLRPLEPDVLGEHLIALVLADTPELAEALIVRSAPNQLRRALTVLTRAARTHEAAKTALRQALRDQPLSVWETAIDVAAETGDPIGLLLAQVLTEAPQPELAQEMLARLPDQTVALRELAAVATEQALQRARTESAGPDRDERVARLLNSLSIRLAELGRREEALGAAEEAVAIRRRLAEARPDAFLPDLAKSLNNLSAFLAGLGRREEALAANEEALATYRGLAEMRPDAFLPDVAWSLSNLSTRLAGVGRREEALGAAEEAVAIRRGLAEARPDAFLLDLASSLLTLSNGLAGLGHREEALAANEEALATYRGLAEARPDAFLPDLAWSLNSLSIRLADLGRRKEALGAAEGAVAIRRRLAEARPDAFLPDLAGSVHGLSGLLADLGRHEEALSAAEETVAIRRRLAEARPDVFLPSLAAGLINQSIVLTDLGRHEEALAAIEYALRSLLPGLKRRPDAHAESARVVLRDYVGRSSAAGREPDPELLRRATDMLGPVE
jgi:tetratricopeptide (TPR) repeat protein